MMTIAKTEEEAYDNEDEHALFTDEEEEEEEALEQTPE